MTDRVDASTLTRLRERELPDIEAGKNGRSSLSQIEAVALIDRVEALEAALELASSAFAHEVDGQHAKAERLIESARAALTGERE